MATELSQKSDEKRLNESFQQPQFTMKISQNSSLLSFPSGVSPSPLPTIEQSGSRYVPSALKLEMEPNIFDHSFNINIQTPFQEFSSNILNANPKVVLPFPTPSPRNTSFFDRFDWFPFSFQGSSGIGSPSRLKDDENVQSSRQTISQNELASNQLQFVSQTCTPLTAESTKLNPSNFLPSNGVFENSFYPNMSNIQRLGTFTTSDALSSAPLLNTDIEYSGLMPLSIPTEPVRITIQNPQTQSIIPVFSNSFQHHNTGLQLIPSKLDALVAAGAVAESTIPMQHATNTQLISQGGRQYIPMDITNLNYAQSIGQVPNAPGLQLLNAAAVAVSGQERNTLTYPATQILTEVSSISNSHPAQLTTIHGFTSVNAPTYVYSQKGNWPLVRNKSFHSIPHQVTGNNNQEIFLTEFQQNSQSKYKRSIKLSSSTKKLGLKDSTTSNSTESTKSTLDVPTNVLQSEILMMDDEEKRRVFLERNRQGKVEFLTKDNENLRTQTVDLVDEIEELKSSGCSVKWLKYHSYTSADSQSTNFFIERFEYRVGTAKKKI
ncbi:hypothetical protein HK096_005641 [Nowakowskiella sp. JEL0078]|nr:hypothetical protein HK096_005641 [Nowakowskiella sp. JEL0078]